MTFEEARKELRKENPEVIADVDRMVSECVKRFDVLDTMEKNIIPREDNQLDTYRLGYNNAIRSMIRRVEHLPAADVVPVVRCRDCKYYAWPEDTTAGMMVCKKYGIARLSFDYCSRGERV